MANPKKQPNAISEQSAANNKIADLEKQIVKLRSDNEGVRRDLGRSRAKSQEQAATIKSLEGSLKKGGPVVVANEEGEQVVCLRESSMVGETMQDAHAVIARFTPCAGASIPFILDAMRTGRARVVAAAEPEKTTEPEKNDDPEKTDEPEKNSK